ncbi:hypothetical protein AAFF_G00122900 [Aldrovandia affinis]|uniref:Uncharacterized protein n=1 Tax=Aldrovandia affinis TaxID=143900 RepID=A0AAD7WAQ1_9TELE|nr:hypothetical protein AAFF_G00122900 [Aldrovandia affinis]
MTGAERLILIGCLLQGALGSEWGIWMPQSIEALSGSCVLIPCRFELGPKWDEFLIEPAHGIWWKGSRHLGDTVFNSSDASFRIKGRMAGDLLQKSCTTVLENFPIDYSDEYLFRLECPNRLKYTFKPGVQINVTDSPPKPKLTPVKVEVTEDMPQISASGSCGRTAAEISCSCESRGNPSPSMEWHVSGLQVTNSTDRVIREEQLGNAGLRSSLTMRHSQGDTPTLLCLSTNTLGNSSLQLLIPSPEQHSGSQCSLALYVIIAALICLFMVTVGLAIHKIKRLTRRLEGGRGGDTYASLQLANVSPEYDVLQVHGKHKEDNTITWEDRHTNTSVLEEANIPAITAAIAQHQLRWTGHVIRMPDSRLPKQVLYSQLLTGQRALGGQKKRYKDNIKANIKKCHIDPKTWEDTATNRATWRKLVSEGAALYNNDLRRAAEDKRKLRKERVSTKKAQSQPTTTTTHPCPHCTKICGYRIGLFAHLKTHRDQKGGQSYSTSSDRR